MTVLVALTVFTSRMTPAGAPQGAGPGYARAVLDLWRLALVGPGSLVLIFAGLTLGASGVGEEYAQGTLDFLLTRPRSRKYFVWTDWLTGVGTLLLMVALAVALSLANLAFIARSALTWRLLATIIPLFVIGAVNYSLTSFVTTLTKNVSSGLTYSLGLILAAALLPVAVHAEWQVNLPSLANLLEISKWATTPGVHFPALATLGWCLIALAFPLVTQFFFERVEL